MTVGCAANLAYLERLALLVNSGLELHNHRGSPSMPAQIVFLTSGAGLLMQ